MSNLEWIVPVVGIFAIIKWSVDFVSLCFKTFILKKPVYSKRALEDRIEKLEVALETCADVEALKRYADFDESHPFGKRSRLTLEEIRKVLEDEPRLNRKERRKKSTTSST